MVSQCPAHNLSIHIFSQRNDLELADNKNEITAMKSKRANIDRAKRTNGQK